MQFISRIYYMVLRGGTSRQPTNTISYLLVFLVVIYVQFFSSPSSFSSSSSSFESRVWSTLAATNKPYILRLMHNLSAIKSLIYVFAVILISLHVSRKCLYALLLMNEYWDSVITVRRWIFLICYININQGFLFMTIFRNHKMN